MVNGEIAHHIMSNFTFAYTIFKKLSTSEASESVCMRERVKVERIFGKGKKKELINMRNFSPFSDLFSTFSETTTLKILYQEKRFINQRGFESV